MVIRELLTKFGLDFQQTDFDKADAAVNGLKQAATSLVALFAAGVLLVLAGKRR